MRNSKQSNSKQSKTKLKAVITSALVLSVIASAGLLPVGFQKSWQITEGLVRPVFAETSAKTATGTVVNNMGILAPSNQTIPNNSLEPAVISPSPLYLTPTLSGADRYETSAKVCSQYLIHNKAEAVVIASGEDFCGAISAIPFASKIGAPVLLTDSNTLQPSTLQF